MSRAHPTFQFGDRKVCVDLPHLAFATAIAGWAGWYAWDASHAGAGIENLILIAPASAGALILYLFVAASCCRVVAGAQDVADGLRPSLAAGVGVKVAGSMALLGGLVVAGPLIGFDVACFVYVAAMLAFLGERRVLMLLLVPLIFCAVGIYGFSKLLGTPLPMVLFNGAL